MDIRKQKSEKAIMTAFFELIKQKDFDRISISEIAKVANVNRGTIYLSYADKTDLFDKFIDYQFGNLMKACKHFSQNVGEISRESLVEIFDYLEEKRAVFQVILSGTGASFFVTKIKDALVSKVRADNSALKIKTGLTENFITCAIMGIFDWWLIDSKISKLKLADELALLLDKLFVCE